MNITVPIQKPLAKAESNVSVSGSSYSGYDVSARVYHEDLGYIDIVGTDLITCSSGFSSGMITVTDSTNSTVLSIVYSGCGEATVTYNGVGETVTF